MTTVEKQQEQRIAQLERMMAEIMDRLGMDAAAMDEFRRRDAVRLMVDKMDPSGIKDYLRRKNSARPMAGAGVSGE